MNVASFEFQDHEINQQTQQVEEVDTKSYQNQHQQLTTTSNFENQTILSNEEKKQLILMTLMFFIQGISLGFVSGISLLLAEQKASMTKQAILTICYYPFSFKLIYAPFIDTFYNEYLGKRRTYIIPTQYMIGALYMSMANVNFTEWVENQQIYKITAVGFLLVFLASIQDIAVFGWAKSSFSDQFVHLASPSQNIGQTLGQIFGSVMMINITSLNFANKYIYSTPQDKPILSLEQFFLISGVVIVILTIIIHIYTHEKSNQKICRYFIYYFLAQGSCYLFLNVIKSIVKLFTNPNLAFIIFFLLTFPFGYGPVTSSTSKTRLFLNCAAIKLIEYGFPKETLSTINFFMSICSILSSIFVGKFLQRGQETTWVFISLILLLIDTIIQFYFVLQFQNLGSYNPETLVIMVQDNILELKFQICIMILDTSVNSFLFCTLGGFFMRILDEKVAGSYFTLLACANNFGGQIASSINLVLLDLINYILLSSLGWIYTIFYIFGTKTKLLSIQHYELSSWEVKLQTE